jgi:hypothetical protein
MQVIINVNVRHGHISTNTTVTFRNFDIFAIRFLILLEDQISEIIGHIIGETFQIEKERKKIDCFSRNVHHDFSISNKFFLKNFFHFCFLEMLEIF